MKKRFLKIALFSIVLVITFIVIRPYFSASPSIQNMLFENINDYNTMAEIYYNDFLKHDDSFLAYARYYEENDEYVVRCYSKEHEHKIVLSDYEYLACQNVINTFRLDGHPLEFIYVYDSFVVFGIANASETLIYSADNKRPSYVNSPKEKKQWFNIRKVTDNWYYAFNS